MRKFLLTLGLVLGLGFNKVEAQQVTCTQSKTSTTVGMINKGAQFVNGVLKYWYVNTTKDSLAGTCKGFTIQTVHDTVVVHDTVLVHDTVVVKDTTVTPPPVDTIKPITGNYPNRPANYIKTLAEFSGACVVPRGANYEYAITGCEPWSIVGNANVSQVDDVTDPASPPKVWRVTMPAGSYGGSGSTGRCDLGTPGNEVPPCFTNSGGSTNFGRWGFSFPAPVSSIYLSAWVKWSPNFYFHQISQKFVRFEMTTGGGFLVQARHNDDFLAAYDSGIDVQWPPTIVGVATMPTRGVWHQVEIQIVQGQFIKVWLDGVLKTNRTGNVGSANFTTAEIHSEMGGGGFILPTEQWFQIGHVLVATVP